MLAFVREHGLEGIVAKRSDSVYQPGQRSGLWAKHRISLGQEFVVGGPVCPLLMLEAIEGQRFPAMPVYARHTFSPCSGARCAG